MRVEDLLRRREPPPADAWEELGSDARELLVQLLDDATVVEHEALRQRVIATIAQLHVTEAIPRLKEQLLDQSESPLTRTFAANALGRIDPDAALEALAQAVSDEASMVRGQVAKALGAARDPVAISYLERLRADPSPHVADVAVNQLRAHGQVVEMEPEARYQPQDVEPPQELTD